MNRQDINMNRMIILVQGHVHYRCDNVLFCGLSKVFLNNYTFESDGCDDYSLLMVYDDEAVHMWDDIKAEDMHDVIAKAKEIIVHELTTKPWKKVKK